MTQFAIISWPPYSEMLMSDPHLYLGRVHNNEGLAIDLIAAEIRFLYPINITIEESGTRVEPLRVKLCNADDFSHVRMRYNISDDIKLRNWPKLSVDTSYEFGTPILVDTKTGKKVKVNDITPTRIKYGEVRTRFFVIPPERSPLVRSAIIASCLDMIGDRTAMFIAMDGEHENNTDSYAELTKRTLTAHNVPEQFISVGPNDIEDCMTVIESLVLPCDSDNIDIVIGI